MADRTNEELLDELVWAVRIAASERSGAMDDKREQERRTAVLARMCGPGEVVVQGWQPIETAPKDGTWIAAWRKHATRMRMLRWDNGYDAWEDDDGTHIYDVTHWMPLFARPNQGGNDDQGK